MSENNDTRLEFDRLTPVTPGGVQYVSRRNYATSHWFSSEYYQQNLVNIPASPIGEWVGQVAYRTPSTGMLENVAAKHFARPIPEIVRISNTKAQRAPQEPDNTVVVALRIQRGIPDDDMSSILFEARKGGAGYLLSGPNQDKCQHTVKYRFRVELGSKAHQALLDLSVRYGQYIMMMEVER